MFKQNDTYRRLSKHLSSIFIPKRRQIWARLMGSIFSPDSRRLRTCWTNRHASKVSIDTLTCMERCFENNAPPGRRICELLQATATARFVSNLWAKIWRCCSQTCPSSFEKWRSNHSNYLWPSDSLWAKFSYDLRYHMVIWIVDVCTRGRNMGTSDEIVRISFSAAHPSLTPVPRACYTPDREHSAEKNGLNATLYRLIGTKNNIRHVDLTFAT